MQDSIDEYGKRLLKNLGEKHFQRIFISHENSCFLYLKEECAALTLLPKKISFNKNEIRPCAIVYPGKSTSILTANHNFFIKEEFKDVIEKYSDFLNWLSYRFIRIKKDKDSNSTISNDQKKPITINMDYDSSILNKVALINKMAEIQLESVENLLESTVIRDFKYCLLHFFLNNIGYSLEQRSLPLNAAEFSPESLAHIVGVQLSAIFNTLDKKLSNKCKANIVRILKRDLNQFDAVDHSDVVQVELV